MVKALCDTFDIVFLEDLSGSFANDLPILKSQIPNLIALVEGLVPNTDFSVGRSSTSRPRPSAPAAIMSIRPIWRSAPTTPR
jgi:hypothetical protein